MEAGMMHVAVVDQVVADQAVVASVALLEGCRTADWECRHSSAAAAWVRPDVAAGAEVEQDSSWSVVYAPDDLPASTKAVIYLVGAGTVLSGTAAYLHYASAAILAVYHL